MASQPNCELCESAGGRLLFRGEGFRVVAVEGAEGLAYTGFCRVIWDAHVREMTDLAHADRARFMDAVFEVEAALRTALAPHKINLASLGNMTPHLHWHVIPRYQDDALFPRPIWAAPATAHLGTLDAQRNRQDATPAEATAPWEEAVRHALEAR